MRLRGEGEKRIVDIHSHILPGLDDGPGSMEETLRMLETAWAEGITDMIATPHYKAQHRSAPPSVVRKRLEQVRRLAEGNGIPVRLWPGNEIFYFSGLEEVLEDRRVCTMNDTGYVLIEFHPADRYTYIRNALNEVQGLGWPPILAHIERYECFAGKPEYAGELHSMGVQIQVNASSVAGEAGMGLKRLTHKLLKEELVDYIGTDAHSSKGRAPMMRKCSRMLYRKYEADYVDAVLYGNAERNLLPGDA